jgi:uncharacterized protein YciI
MPDPTAPAAPSPVPAEGPTGPIQTLNAAESKSTVVTPSPNAKPEKPSAPATQVRPEPRVVSRKELAERGRVSVAEKLLGREPKKPETPRAPDGKFAPKDPNAPAAPKPPAKPKEEAAPEPVAEPAKIKVGDQEMTEAEVQAHIAKLTEKANAAPTLPVAAPEPPKAPEPPAPQPTAEETQAEEARKDAEFTQNFIAAHGIKQEDIDKMLATGDSGPLNAALARVAMDARKFIADHVNKAIDEIRSGISPVLERESQLSEFQKEYNFLAAPENKDIADAKDAGKQAYREGAKLVRGYLDQLTRLVKSGAATPEEIATAKALETPEQFAADVAYHARNALRSRQAAAPVSTAPVTPPAPPKPRPEPPGGQPTGAGGGAPVSTQAAVRARIAHTR